MTAAVGGSGLAIPYRGRLRKPTGENFSMQERRRWTPEDIDLLKSLARRYPAEQIAKELGRGLPATVMKAHTLGISLRLKPKRESGQADIRENRGAAGPGERAR
jgi:hypothetical protein